MKNWTLTFLVIYLILISGCVQQSPSQSDLQQVQVNTVQQPTPPVEQQENMILPPVNEQPSQFPTQIVEQTSQAEIASWALGGAAVPGKYADAEVVDLGNGAYRMYYSAQPEVQNFMGQVYSSTSTDGINWKQESGERSTGSTFPDVVKLSNGKYRMYYQNAQLIKSSTSSDGLVWKEESGTRINADADGLTLDNVAAPTVIETDDGYVMVYRGTINERYTAQAPNPNTQLLLWATSDDGLTFEKKGIALDSRNSTFSRLMDGPELVKWDDGSIRLYFWSYSGVYHSVFDGTSFSDDIEFDYTTSTNSLAPFPENPPGDPTVAKIAGKWFMYYGQHPQGIYYATLIE